MPLIKARTRGKQLVRHITQLDRETNETLYAYAHFLGEADRVRPESARRHSARQRQGVRDVASGAPRIVRRAANATSAAVCAAHFRRQIWNRVSGRSGWRRQQ